jgi:hypothetical protein
MKIFGTFTGMHLSLKAKLCINLYKKYLFDYYIKTYLFSITRILLIVFMCMTDADPEGGKGPWPSPRTP